MELCRYYSLDPQKIKSYKISLLRELYSAMVSSKAVERLHRIEELACRYMKKEERQKFLDIIYKQVDDKYKDPREVGEDELKRILNGFR